MCVNHERLCAAGVSARYLLGSNSSAFLRACYIYSADLNNRQFSSAFKATSLAFAALIRAKKRCFAEKQTLQPKFCPTMQCHVPSNFASAEDLIWKRKFSKKHTKQRRPRTDRARAKTVQKNREKNVSKRRIRTRNKHTADQGCRYTRM